MQLIGLIISNGRISSKMLFRILGAWLFAFYKIILNCIKMMMLRWQFRSFVFMFCNFINWALVNEVIQVHLLLIGSAILLLSVILETVLGKLWEVLEVICFASVCNCRLRLFLVFNCIKALSINIFFLFHTTIHMIYRWKLHLGVLSVFISCFRTSLSFVITPINWS